MAWKPMFATTDEHGDMEICGSVMSWQLPELPPFSALGGREKQPPRTTQPRNVIPYWVFPSTNPDLDVLWFVI